MWMNLNNHWQLFARDSSEDLGLRGISKLHWTKLKLPSVRGPTSKNIPILALSHPNHSKKKYIHLSANFNIYISFDMFDWFRRCGNICLIFITFRCRFCSFSFIMAVKSTILIIYVRYFDGLQTIDFGKSDLLNFYEFFESDHTVYMDKT